MSEAIQTGCLQHIDYDQADGALTLRCLGEQVTLQGDLLHLRTDNGARAAVSHTLQRIGPLLTIDAEAVFGSDCTVESVQWFAGRLCGADEIVVASTHLSDICLFAHRGGVSFFLSLDFPYSRIQDNHIGYEPLDAVAAGTGYRPHGVSIGAVKLTGRRVGPYDRAEIEGMCQYIQTRHPPRFDRAVFSTTSITNRMTDVREGRIFYSMQDNPTLTLDLPTLKHEVDLCAQLGIEYYQVFEGYFDWEDDGSTARALDELAAYAGSLGVRVGDYVHPGDLYCPHYNYHHRHLDRPEWRVLAADGNRGQFCYGCDGFVEYIASQLEASVREHGEQMICLDMLHMQPCYDTSHGHAPGDLYRQVRGLVRFMERLNATSPQFMMWSNSGNWLEFMPKLLWYNHNVYLSDPHPRAYGSALNMLKYYADCRREQMVSVHNQYFVPYGYYTNCEYYAFPHGRVDDLQFFEYSFLQGLCVTPNICLGELRVFLQRVPAGRQKYCMDFMKRWMDFTRKHFFIWKNTLQLGDSPGAGANEAYAHVAGDRGWVCLVNQNHSPQRFTIKLDESIGLSAGSQYLLTEEYPMTCPIAEQPLPCAMRGDAVTLTADAYSVRIVRIEPYAPAGEAARLYGLEGCVRMLPGGAIAADISGECGKTYDAAISIPGGLGVAALSVQTRPGLPMYTFPSNLHGLRVQGNVARFKLTMPRDRFRRVLTGWSSDDGDTLAELAPDNSDFLGGYIHNFYNERQYAVLTVDTQPAQESRMPALAREIPAARPPAKRRHSIYRCVLDIPFIEWPAMARAYGYDEVIEMVFTNHRAVRAISAALDGVACTVNRYTYPVSADMWTWYIALTGLVISGKRPVLEIRVQWEDESPTQPGPGEAPRTQQAFVLGQT